MRAKTFKYLCRHMVEGNDYRATTLSGETLYWNGRLVDNCDAPKGDGTLTLEDLNGVKTVLDVRSIVSIKGRFTQ